MIAVYGVGESEGEVEEGAPLVHGDAEEVGDPVEIVFCGEAVEDDAAGCDDHSREHDAETHFSFTDTVVLAGEVGGEAIGGAQEGHCEEEAEEGSNGYEAGVCLGNVLVESSKENRV